MNGIIASVFLSFAFAMLLTPITIKILRRRGILAVDYYKRERREVPKSGGIAVISASLLSFSILINTYYNHCKIDFVAILLMLFYGIFGAIDDFTDIGSCLLYTSPSPRDRG